MFILQPTPKKCAFLLGWEKKGDFGDVVAFEYLIEELILKHGIDEFLVWGVTFLLGVF